MTDRERFEEIYMGHYDAVYRYCLRRSTRDNALDATGETFVTAWRRVGDIPEGFELPWLYRVARNVLSHQHRSAGRHAAAMTQLEGSVFSVERTVEDEVLAGEATAELLSALGQLSSSDREVIQLAGWEELDRVEVAVALGCSPNGASKRLNRALDRLANELGVTERTGGRFFARRVAR